MENALLHVVMDFVPLLRQTVQKRVRTVRLTVEHVLFVAMDLVMVTKPSGLVLMTVVLPITVVMVRVLLLLMKITLTVPRIVFKPLGVAMGHVVDLRCVINVSQIVEHVLVQIPRRVAI